MCVYIYIYYYIFGIGFDGMCNRQAQLMSPAPTPFIVRTMPINGTTSMLPNLFKVPLKWEWGCGDLGGSCLSFYPQTRSAPPPRQKCGTLYKSKAPVKSGQKE